MTPYELSILLDLYSGKPIAADPEAPIFVPTMRAFMNEGWVTSTATSAYSPTQKLDAFMGFVLNLPAPVQEWRMPELRVMKEAA
jgi:hypothetical protein